MGREIVLGNGGITYLKAGSGPLKDNQKRLNPGDSYTGILGAFKDSSKPGMKGTYSLVTKEGRFGIPADGHLVALINKGEEETGATLVGVNVTITYIGRGDMPGTTEATKPHMYRLVINDESAPVEAAPAPVAPASNFPF